MPTFYEEAEFDIEPYEYVSSCSKREIKELIEELVDSGHLSRSAIQLKTGDTPSILDMEWDDICYKIQNNRLNLSNEEEELIRKISKRF